MTPAGAPWCGFISPCLRVSDAGGRQAETLEKNHNMKTPDRSPGSPAAPARGVEGARHSEPRVEPEGMHERF